ncbi:MAG: 16S rRNA (adenine(1518)-N(6)/adenine(1519)-N(6))-dimethyltransferase RsmA [Desulfosalsimonadaceae bacterium]
MTFPGRILAAKNLFPKKHMGQNFLVDPSTAEMIVRRAGVSAKDAAIEIGAGLGALSVPLARCAKTLYAVEKDRDLMKILSDLFEEKEIGNAILINRNIFDIDLSEIAQAENTKLILFGNLPYNISSQVVIWAIEHRQWIDRAVFMFQKEVAQRIAASPGSGDYGRLSVMVQYCSRVKRIARLDARQFYPRPKVDSEVIEFCFEQGGRPPVVDETLFAAVVKAAFGKRRKTLKNALGSGGIGIDDQTAACLWEKTAINPARRAETLTVSEFVELTNALEKLRGIPRQAR